MKPILRLILFVFLTLVTAAYSKKYDLAKAIRVTLEQNLEIRRAANQVWSAKNQLREQTAERLPQVALDYDYQYNDDRVDSTGDISTDTLALTASQELFRIGKEESYTFSARKDLINARAELEDTRLEQIIALRKAFIEYLLIKDEIGLRTDLAKEFKLRYERMQGRLDAGKVKPIDVKEARLEYLDEQLRVNIQKSSLRDKKLALMNVMGIMLERIPDDVEFEGNISDFMDNPLSKQTLKFFLDKGEQSRVELKSRADILKLQRRRTFWSYFQWMPEMSSGEAYYTTSSGKLKFNIDNSSESLWRALFGYTIPIRGDKTGLDNNLWGFKIDFTLPLFSGFKKFAKLNQDRAALMDLELEMQQEVNRIRLQISNAYSLMLNLMERERIEKERVQTTKERMLIIEELIELPLKTYITYDDVLSRRQSFTNAQQSYFLVRKEYLFAIEELKKAVGTYEDVIKDE